jgi:hypothetical protein
MYQWQVETSPNNFIHLTDGPVTWGGCGLVSGSNTATLTLTPDPVLTAESSARFRCIVSNGCSYVISAPAAMNFCPGDYNCDGGTDGDDVGAFFNDWSNAAPSADLNCDGGVDFGDSDYFFERWGAPGIFFGHFVGPVRAVIAVVAGIVKMPPLQFHLANWSASFVWGFMFFYGFGLFGQQLAR